MRAIAQSRCRDYCLFLCRYQRCFRHATHQHEIQNQTLPDCSERHATPASTGARGVVSGDAGLDAATFLHGVSSACLERARLRLRQLLRRQPDNGRHCRIPLVGCGVDGRGVSPAIADCSCPRCSIQSFPHAAIARPACHFLNADYYRDVSELLLCRTPCLVAPSGFSDIVIASNTAVRCG